MESQPPLAALALAITAQDWTCMGLGRDPNVAATNDFDVTVERVAALLLARIVAVAAPPLSGCRDLSTTSICRSAIVSGQPWPDPISDEMIEQLREYVRRIMGGYNDTPYHNFEHAYHVIISINKLIDLVLNLEIHGKRRPTTYGFRNDPMMHLVLVFSALIHDVEHTGVPNRQLVMEDDPLAILYNDQSIAENRSLYIGFSELLKDDFKLLRRAMFPTTDEYLRFRKTVINLILTTDIASPERTQIGKSKWKEAFGDPFETVERKVRSEIRRRSSMASMAGQATRRASRCSMTSAFSEITEDYDNVPAESSDESDSRTPDSSSVDDEDPDDGVIFSGATLSATPSNYSADLRAELGYGSPSLSRPTLNSQESVGSLGYSQMKNRLPPSVAGSVGSTGNGLPGRPGLSAQDSVGSLGYSQVKRGIDRGLSEGFLSDNFPKRDLGYDPVARYNNQKVNLQINPYDSRSRSSITSATNLEEEHAKFNRRFSSCSIATTNSRRYKYRLGILRSVDITGEAIETYSRSSSIAPSMRGSIVNGNISSALSVGTGRGSFFSGSIETEIENEDVDELKISVILEQMIAAADVAHNLQGWDHMVKWSTRLFMELKKAYQAGRGTDPKHRWFENQIGFLESYLLPLARRLEDTGVFGEVIGSAFARIVESNRDRWLTDGLVVTSGVILEGAKKFPVDGDVLDDDWDDTCGKHDSFAGSATSAVVE